MAKKPAVGYAPSTHWETIDWRRQATNDAVSGRATGVSGVPAAQQASYTEAYTWGQWFKLMQKRNSM